MDTPLDAKTAGNRSASAARTKGGCDSNTSAAILTTSPLARRHNGGGWGGEMLVVVDDENGGTRDMVAAVVADPLPDALFPAAHAPLAAAPAAPCITSLSASLGVASTTSCALENRRMADR